MSHAPDLTDIGTPALLLDEARMSRNIDRLAAQADALGVTLRPHLKTAKSTEIARRLGGPITVSTLAEAEVFHAAGHGDILYAVGIAPQKLPRVQALRAQGCDLTVILDSAAQAEAAARAGVPALIEIDSDGHRGGLAPDAPALVEVGRILHGAGLLRGVITHAGESYGARGREAHAEFAEMERSATVRAAEALRGAGLPCPVVSVGSTPTAHAARDLSGVTELRAGVYMFFDLVMAGIGVCEVDDIALSVLTTVIGHQQAKGWVMVDAGWMALSRDRGTAAQSVDQGYGLVCDAAGQVIPDLIVSGANQEHGIVSLRPGSTAMLPDLPLGTQLRILPNHACATAAQHGQYHLLPAGGGPRQVWPRFGGW
ncbi:alanine racemase [Alloyangia pacifica]|uniref:D-serine deaminase, pyridoxal phosphate-dependent n=1 Tax=Alloyangia pacifica TaxID=311180 RepID=A0A1I6RFP5_9RHOB|nr:alanine racemase [Alloyangia pacifica]SDG49192.1 D-serine deaminase, pyridoxal phosphate-dependent [Alloyangia pacifica]SFS63549.1 D-serine deaminase, pyridoxal phosphate-dependent [Alloyangia pacifica]